MALLSVRIQRTHSIHGISKYTHVWRRLLVTWCWWLYNGDSLKMLVTNHNVDLFNHVEDLKMNPSPTLQNGHLYLYQHKPPPIFCHQRWCSWFWWPISSPTSVTNIYDILSQSTFYNFAEFYFSACMMNTMMIPMLIIIRLITFQKWGKFFYWKTTLSGHRV